MLTLIALSVALMQEPPAPPAPPAPPELQTRFIFMGADGPGGLDKDNDGQITREEFAGPINDHFGRIDADGDGRLSTEELSARHRQTGEGGEQNVMIMRGAGGHGGEGMQRFELHSPGDEHEIRIVTGGGGHGGPGVRHLEMHPEYGERAAHGEGRTTVFIGGAPGAGGEREIILHGGRSAHVTGGHATIGGAGERIHIRRMGRADGEHDLDADNDGRISEAEFSAPLRDAFARIDADRSGFIEAGERGSGDGAEVFVHRVETRPGGED